MSADLSYRNQSVYLQNAAADFFLAARAKAYGKLHGIGEAERYAQSRGASPRVREMLGGKAIITEQTLKTALEISAGLPLETKDRAGLETKAAAAAASLSGWGAELALIQDASRGFLALLPPFSAFDRLLADHAITPYPLHTRLGAAVNPAFGSSVSEGSSKPLTMMAFNSTVMPAQKAQASVLYSGELLITNAGLIDDLFAVSLRNGVAAETDREFLATISTGNTANPIVSRPSSGNLVHDIDLALGGIETGIGSQLYLIMPRHEYHTAKLLRDAGGYIVSPGGMVGDVQLIPTSAKNGKVPITYSVLVDGTCISADGGYIISDSTKEADIIPDDTGTGQPPVRTWQQNLVSTRVEHYWGATVIRSEGIAVITGLDVTA